MKDISVAEGVLQDLGRDFDDMIVLTLSEMVAKNVPSATVTAKLSISLEAENIIAKDGKLQVAIYPRFKHDVSSKIAVKEKIQGETANLGELRFDGKGRAVVSAQDEQLKMEVE